MKTKIILNLCAYAFTFFLLGFLGSFPIFAQDDPRICGYGSSYRSLPIPKEAKDKGISGKVELEVSVNSKNEIVSVKTISGHPLLVKTALEESKKRHKEESEKAHREGKSTSASFFDCKEEEIFVSTQTFDFEDGISLDDFMKETKKREKLNPDYDKKMAEKAGANDFGLKTYYLVNIVVPKDADPAEIKRKTEEYLKENKSPFSLMFRHIEVLTKLQQEGISLFTVHRLNYDASELSEKEKETKQLESDRTVMLMVVNAEKIEKAREIIAESPLIKIGMYKPRYLNVSGTAALMLIPELSKKMNRLDTNSVTVESPPINVFERETNPQKN